MSPNHSSSSVVQLFSFFGRVISVEGAVHVGDLVGFFSSSRTLFESFSTGLYFFFFTFCGRLCHILEGETKEVKNRTCNSGVCVCMDRVVLSRCWQQRESHRGRWRGRGREMLLRLRLRKEVHRNALFFSSSLWTGKSLRYTRPCASERCGTSSLCVFSCTHVR